MQVVGDDDAVEAALPEGPVLTLEVGLDDFDSRLSLEVFERRYVDVDCGDSMTE